jgi:alcohol dehydrogenase
MGDYYNFQYQGLAQVHAEFGAAKNLGEILRAQGDEAHVFFVTDPGIKKLGLATPAIQSLKKHKFEVTVFDEVAADPSEDLVLAAVKIAKEAKVDLVVGFGGGSSMDVAKLVAALVGAPQSIKGIYGLDNVKGNRLPMVMIPTTSGTGSEATNISVVTTNGAMKSGVVDPTLYADLAILDAELTLGLPNNITAYTAIDAMVHCIEAYTGIHHKNPYSDMLALKGLQLLNNNLMDALEDGENVEARSNLLLGSFFAGQAFTNSPVAAIHALAYPLGGMFHLPHGLSNALVMPHMIRFNAEAAETNYADLASVVLPGIGGSDYYKTNHFIEWADHLITSCGLKNRLRDYEITEADMLSLAKAAMLHPRLLKHNPREVTEEDAEKIYKAAY